MGCFGLVGWGLIMCVDHIYIYICVCVVCVCVCVFVNTLMYEKAYFSIKAAVLNSSPRAPALLTHLIQIISSLEVRSEHELCSD